MFRNIQMTRECSVLRRSPRYRSQGYRLSRTAKSRGTGIIEEGASIIAPKCEESARYAFAFEQRTKS